MRRKKTEITDENLLPEIIRPIVQPAEKPVNPKGGRRSLEPLENMSRKVAKGKEYYLENAFNILLRNIAEELPCKCSENCPYESACWLEEASRPRNMEGGDPVTGERCPIEYDLIMTSFYGYLAELEINYTRPTEVQTAAKLSGLQVYQRRIDCLINEQGMIIEDGVAMKNGDIAITHNRHPLWDVRKELERREEAILKQFHATREQSEKAKREEMNKEKLSAAQWLSRMAEAVEEK